MYTHNLINQFMEDFSYLITEHDIAASNERIWAAGSCDTNTANMHKENAEEHLIVSAIYHKMQVDILAIIEKYAD